MTCRLALYDTAALRRVEAQAASALGDDFLLMQRAGQAAWRCLLQHWPQAQRIAVTCGPGNNGGDGYVLARHAQQSGREVVVVRLPEHAPRTPNAIRACSDYVASGGRVAESVGVCAKGDVLVDALFGIGLSRAPDAAAAALVAAMNASNLPVLALDAPSGIDADRGCRDGKAVRATRTLEFIAAHVGLRTGEALDYTGHCELASLDVPATAWHGIVPAAEWLEPPLLAHYLSPRSRNSHKGRYGHVLCIGGDLGMGGAVLLCAEAALRSGAGLVSVATRPAHVAALLARLPECMAVGITDAARTHTLLPRADVVALGPGLGRDAWGRGLLDAALQANRPMVIDADALNLLCDGPRSGVGDAILTPHPGEAARLLGVTTPEVQAARVASAQRIAERFACVVVLKGAGSIVAAPARTPCIIGAGNPGMATGGMGDVLTGVIAALRAQGSNAFDAACAGALLHGHAGDMAARDGERGLLPSDVLACLRREANPSSAR